MLVERHFVYKSNKRYQTPLLNKTYKELGIVNYTVIGETENPLIELINYGSNTIPNLILLCPSLNSNFRNNLILDRKYFTLLKTEILRTMVAKGYLIQIARHSNLLGKNYNAELVKILLLNDDSLDDTIVSIEKINK